MRLKDWYRFVLTNGLVLLGMKVAAEISGGAPTRHAFTLAVVIAAMVTTVGAFRDAMKEPTP